MEEEPLVSVIIPIYNVENYIVRCLKSIQSQTYKNFECIIINDGSTDNSAEIAEKFIQPDKRFKVIHQINKGLGGARNSGLENALGEYVCFIDSDDWVVMDFLKILISSIVESNADIVGCNMILYFEDGHEKINSWNHSATGKDGIINIPEIFKALFEYHITWNKIYKKKLFSEIRFPEKLYFEDFATTYKLSFVTKKLVFIDEPLYYYFQREDSIIHTFSEKKLMDKFLIFTDMEKFLTGKIENDKEFLRFVYLSNIILKNCKEITYSNIKFQEKISLLDLNKKATNAKLFNFKNILNTKELNIYWKIVLLSYLKSSKLTYYILKLKPY